MSVLSAITDRLADRLADRPDVRVCGAAELAALGTRRDKGPATSAVYVLPLEEQAPPAGDVIGPARALVRVGFGIVIRAVNRRDRRGEAAAEDVEALRERVRAAVYGWEPDGASAPLLLRRGALLDAAQGEVWWQDEYETEVLITADDAPAFEALTWVFDSGTPSAIANRFAGTFSSNAGHWSAESDPAATSSEMTGPSANNQLAFIHTETTTAVPITIIDDLGILTMLATGGAQGQAWLLDTPVARRITLRCCLQGAFDAPVQGGEPEGLAVEHRATENDAWETSGFIRGWEYADTRSAGDEVVDFGDEAFTVAADGGWRDVAVDIPANAREVRLRPRYLIASGGPASDNSRHDIALYSVTLDIAEAA